jgi:hypothetical protein
MGTTPDDGAAKLDAYIAATARSFPLISAQVQEALALIGRFVKAQADAQGLQLLALRRYLRIGPKRVHAQWAWTAEQAEVLIYQGVAKQLVNEAAKVQAIFAKNNPGYRLALSPLRSLERQVRLWDGNSTVRKAASGLRSDVLEDLDDDDQFPDPPTGKSVPFFRDLLRGYPVSPEPTSAAPGTSDHGQMRAVDFVVMRTSGVEVAGTMSSSIPVVWKRGGWEAKLIAAAETTQLVGPLQHPYEPWHWRLPR